MLGMNGSLKCEPGMIMASLLKLFGEFSSGLLSKVFSTYGPCIVHAVHCSHPLPGPDTSVYASNPLVLRDWMATQSNPLTVKMAVSWWAAEVMLVQTDAFFCRPWQHIYLWRVQRTVLLSFKNKL